ncbi:hypothetical protein [Zunongwangia sp.]|uniref:hypothetical protein n=1 Tax=Zunongwangia sp. TaxID=1965325 RepID=UPI003AA7C239
MRIFRIIMLLLLVATLTNCASGYKPISPKNINYLSTNLSDSVRLDYKYGLLRKKYAKKELKKGVKLVAIKITNNSNRDLKFGRDAKLTYESGDQVYIMENQEAFKTLKQSPASYLWYLLLTPLNVYTSKTETSNNGYYEESSSSAFPVGLIVGPGLAGGNLIAASSANKKFKNELLQYDINGTVIKKGETKYGLIGIYTYAFDALKLKIEK